jgi:hypothetical protein
MKRVLVGCLTLVALNVVPLLPPPWRKASAEEGPKKVVYKPRFRGAPKNRIGGGSRGEGDALPSLFILASEHTGLTINESPALFWYLSKAPGCGLELTILEGEEPEPLLQVKVKSSEQQGICRLDLSTLGVKLKPDVEYQWLVALVPDAANRSKDFVASGWIKRIKTPDELAARIAKAEPAALPAIYAEEGLWVDALAAISDLIHGRPDDAALREARASLLEEQGLKEAAAHDRRKESAE